MTFSSQSLSATGFAATAISYGPARMGFRPVRARVPGPPFRCRIRASASSRALASAGFFGRGPCWPRRCLLLRVGPAVPVLVGLAAATLGLGIVVRLHPASGCLRPASRVAASSARGFAWTPFQRCRAPPPRSARGGGGTARPPCPRSAPAPGSGVSLAGATGPGPWVLLGFRLALRLGRLRGGERAGVCRKLGRPSPCGQGPPDRTRSRGGAISCSRPAIPLFPRSPSFYGVTSAVYLSFAPTGSRSKASPGLPGGATRRFCSSHYGLCGPRGPVHRRGARRHRAAVASCGFCWARRRARSRLAALLPGSWVGLLLSRAAGRQRDDDERGSRLLVGTAVPRPAPPSGSRGGAAGDRAGNIPRPGTGGAGLGLRGRGHRRCSSAPPRSPACSRRPGCGRTCVVDRPQPRIDHIGGRARPPRKRAAPLGCPCPFPRPSGAFRSFVFQRVDRGLQLVLC